MMTQKAHQLGMAHTNYANASGLPDPQQLTTARDIARLALALYQDFPREYRYFSVKEFNFQGAIVNGHDHMLDWYPGADGIKTGFTVASGFNLATSAVQNGRRLIGVILGGRSVHSRDESMAQLLDLGFGDLARQAPVMVAQRQAPAEPAVAAATPAPAAQPVAPSLAALAAASMTPPPAPRPAAPAVQATVPSQAPISDQPPEHPPATVAAIADAAIQQLAPVVKAEAAAAPIDPNEAWGIQIGAFRAEAAAEQVERDMTQFAFAKGKEPQIIAPSGNERLYRARLLRFTAQGAHAACGELHKQHFDCSIVPPVGVRVASR
jgi:D-alanyl-D-alanine carboxypeptidase